MDDGHWKGEGQLLKNLAPSGRWLCLALAIGGLIAGGASAQESSKEIVGKWAGFLERATGPSSSIEVEFKPDGAFGGSSSSPRFGLVTYSGRWKVEGGTVLVDYVAQGAREKAETSWNLKYEGDMLSGTGLRKSDNDTFGLALLRVGHEEHERVRLQHWLIGEWSGAYTDAALRMQTFQVVFLHDRSCYGTVQEGGTGPSSGVTFPFSCNWKVIRDGVILVEGTWNEPRFNYPFRHPFKKNGEGLEELRGRIHLHRAEKR